MTGPFARGGLDGDQRADGKYKPRLCPAKTRIVYCKDGTRLGSDGHVSFDFLGLTLQRPDSKEVTVPEIAELGHTGLWVFDLPAMKDFYTRILGLQVTDEDKSFGMVFLSARPDAEHHELVLQSGRDAAVDAKVVHQISWRMGSLEDLVKFYRRFVAEGVRIQQTVTHGNAFGIYFFDPEGNRNEVYWQTGEKIPQPYRKTLNVDQDPEAILQDAALLLSDGTSDYQPVQ